MSEQLPPELEGKRDQILQHATSRGMRMRVRRRVAIAATVVVGVTAAVGTASALVGTERHAARVATTPDGPARTTSTTAAQASTTTSESTVVSPTTAPVDVSTSTSTPVTDTSMRPVTTEPSTSTTALVCHNSYDPRCGPLTFTSIPVNKPLKLSTGQTVTGLSVKLHVHASDDSAVDPCMTISWGDGQSSYGPSRFGCTAAGTCIRFRERYGPWDPPPPTPESITIDFPHAYKHPGTFAVSIKADSAVPCSPDQFYASNATASTRVTIAKTSPTTIP